MRKRILVIDDDEAVRKAFLLALEDTGYQVDTAESGEKGIKMEKKNKYDLFFLDLHMPGLNGVETLRALRKIDKNVPIYVVTAFYKMYFEELIKAEKEGISFDVVRKPIGGDQIVLVAQGALEGTA